MACNSYTAENFAKVYANYVVANKCYCYCIIRHHYVWKRLCTNSVIKKLVIILAAAAISSSTSTTDELPYSHHRHRQTQQQEHRNSDQIRMTLDSPSGGALFHNLCNRTVSIHKSRRGNTCVAGGGSTGRSSSSSFSRAPGGVRLYHCRMCRKVCQRHYQLFLIEQLHNTIIAASALWT